METASHTRLASPNRLAECLEEDIDRNRANLFKRAPAKTDALFRIADERTLTVPVGCLLADPWGLQEDDAWIADDPQWERYRDIVYSAGGGEAHAKPERAYAGNEDLRNVLDACRDFLQACAIVEAGEHGKTDTTNTIR